MISDVHPHLPWALYTHYYCWWQPYLRDDKAFEKCTNWFWVLPAGMHSNPVAVGKYTSTSEQFSHQVRRDQVFLTMYIHLYATTRGLGKRAQAECHRHRGDKQLCTSLPPSPHNHVSAAEKGLHEKSSKRRQHLGGQSWARDRWWWWALWRWVLWRVWGHDTLTFISVKIDRLRKSLTRLLKTVSYLTGCFPLIYQT